MEARDRSLSSWFARIQSTQVVLPRFQRFEAWTHRHVVDLLDTVLRELPAGALLVLEIGDEEPFISRPMEGAPHDGGSPTEHLLDGQQRLTALWRSLNGDYPDRTYTIERIPDDPEDIEEDLAPGEWRADSEARYERNGRHYPLWIDSPSQTWERGKIPVELLAPGPDAETRYYQWAQDAAGEDSTELIELVKIGADLRNRIGRFNLPFLSLPRGTPRETALDVFVRMNTSAQPLSTFDIVVAQVEAGTGHSLHELVEDLGARAPGLEVYADLPDVILTAGAYLQDRSPRKSVLLAPEFSEGLIVQWDMLVRGVKKTVTFLDEERVFDNRRVPSDPAIPLLVALWAEAPDGLDGEGHARELLRRFMWRAFLTDRYERSTNTRSLADFRSIRTMLNGNSRDLPPIFDDDLHPLPDVDALRGAGWPGKKDRLGRAVMLLALRGGGLDFADASHASRQSLEKREYHHIFPRAFLRDKGVDEALVNRALNCALVTWRTNRNIAAKEPAAYVRERIDQATVGEDEVRRRLTSHRIPVDALMRGDYDRFLDGRAELMAEEVKRVCG